MSLSLTGKHVLDLAEFVGFQLAKADDDVLETLVSLHACPSEGIYGGDKEGIPRHYELLASLTEYPEEGCHPLGDEFPEPCRSPFFTYAENQNTVSRWAEDTFGPAGSNLRVATRANEEMAELLRALSIDDNHPETGEELADLQIILWRLADKMGLDIRTEVDRKMATNRKRHWERDGSGHGYHTNDPKS